MGSMTNPRVPATEADWEVSLADCPIGLFWCGETLALKTEYGNNDGRIDAYIVSSGEFFWGHAPQSIASQRATVVRPIDTDDASHRLAHQPSVKAAGSEDTECTPPLSQEMIAGIQRIAKEYQKRNSAIPAIKQRPGESHWTAIQRHLREDQMDRWGEFNLRLQLIRGIEVQAIGAALSGGRFAEVEHAYNRLRDMIDALIAEGTRR